MKKKTGLGVLDDIPNPKKRLSYEISEHFEHATGFCDLRPATTEIYVKFSEKKINAAHHKAKGLTLENKQINHQQYHKLNLTMQGNNSSSFIFRWQLDIRPWREICWTIFNLGCQ